MTPKNDSARKLYEQGYLTPRQWEELGNYRARNIFSLHTELRLLLYIGILAFTTGIGILVYKNLDTIGHLAIIITVAAACVACFAWSVKHAQPFTTGQAKNDNPFFDYVVLAACLLAGIFTGYIQFQYGVFGTHYGLATLVPAVLYVATAYYFDHRGVLSLAITALAAWLGITLTPSQFFLSGFTTQGINQAGIFLGVALVLYTLYAQRAQLKTHFNYTCLNFALHLLFIGSLTGLFNNYYWALMLLPIVATGAYFFRQAYAQRSFNFMLFTTLYVYIAITYTLGRVLIHGLDDIIVLVPFYFMASLALVILWLIRFKKSIKA